MQKPIVLIVDDEPANLSVLSQLLQRHYLVRACKSGAQALDIALSSPPPDLILLDVMMPGMDGFSVLSRLLAAPTTREIPVIFVTALDEDIDEEFGLQLGAVDYITKPIKPAVLMARVRAHLELKQGRDRLREQNSWLESEVQRRTKENVLIQDVSLCVIMELAETRDTDTGNHITRTQAYVHALARQLRKHPDFAAELDEDSLLHIVKAAPLHDIGKIGIPDSILLKPGALTPEEWAIMKTHTTLGGETIRRAIHKALTLDGIQKEARPEALKLLEAAQSIALGHHEKWDGSGYPSGLRERQIPLPARLMALADVFDALTTHRVYKSPWEIDDAVDFIRRNSGTSFDPDVVDAFETILPEFIAICNRLADAKGEQRP